MLAQPESRAHECLDSEGTLQTCERHGIQPGQLTIHADRGSSMRSKLVAQLLADLGVTKTHSRPHVSNDNPFSEAGFKTLKYRPDFPERFGCLEDARAYCVDFFAWYNGEHYHSGIGLNTPNDVHYGRAQQRVEDRSRVLAYPLHQARSSRTRGVMAAWLCDACRTISSPTPSQAAAGS